MRVLITGGAGFVAGHLVEHLTAHHPECALWLLDLPGRFDPPRLGAPPTVSVLEGDLTEPAAAERAVAESRPDVVLHLAATTSVAGSWADPAAVLRINALSQVNLLEAIAGGAPDARVVIASSAEVYGRVDPDRQPIREDEPLAPISPYGVSKATQDLIGFQYHAARGLDVVRLRLFNHTGPRQPSRFVCSGLARQIAEIEIALRSPRIEAGDLDVERDFTDVRDVVRAWWMAAAAGEPGAVYNVCSGSAVTIRRVLDLLLAHSGATVVIQPDPGRSRPADIRALAGRPDRLTDATGWRPEIPLGRTLADLLNWWRTELATGARPE